LAFFWVPTLEAAAGHGKNEVRNTKHPQKKNIAAFKSNQSEFCQTYSPLNNHTGSSMLPKKNTRGAPCIPKKHTAGSTLPVWLLVRKTSNTYGSIDPSRAFFSQIKTTARHDG
jgi:hypothetical protein